MADKTTYHLPAEWAPQWGVQLTWPHEGTDWQPILGEITATYVDMAVEIARRERLVIVAPDPEKAITAIRERVKDEPETLENITILACDTDDTWARDHGFITLLSQEGERLLLDFRFNGWGEKFAAEKDNAINRKLYGAGLVEGCYESQLDFVLEGGSIESDGKGTVFTTTKCLTAPHRNQPMDRNAIEQRLKQSLRARRIVWIDHGELVGDDTDGHIDTLVRLAPDDTLLYVGCGDPTDVQCHGLRLMEEQLKELRTTVGNRPYRLLRLPSPKPIVRDGERLPATYANFLVVNGAVLCPTYGQEETDKAALETIAEAFPGRETIGIDCRSIIIQHGSLHCCTMQIPLWRGTKP